MVVTKPSRILDIGNESVVPRVLTGTDGPEDMWLLAKRSKARKNVLRLHYAAKSRCYKYSFRRDLRDGFIRIA